MKKVFLILLLSIPLIAFGEGGPKANLVIAYKSLNDVDISAYGYDAFIVNSLEEIAFLYPSVEENGLPTMILETECVSIQQVELGGKKYELYYAKIKGKLTVLAADGTIAYIGDIELFKTPAANPKAAEIEAIQQYKKEIAAKIEKDRTLILEGF